MNNFKTSIKNYQIIKNMNLEFIPGLNVIVGPSNNGKTSILKAVKALLYTVPGSTSIRSGQSSYVVGINYNQHTIILQKGQKESVYLVDGEKYTKFGTSTPEAVSNSLNIKELVLNGNKEQLNFWDQMNYPFLLDKSSTELFKFIVDSGEDDQVSKVLKTMVSDRQSISREIDMIQGSINMLDTEIEAYEKQVEEGKSKIEICNKIIELQSSVSRLNNLKILRQSILDTKTQKDNITNNYDKIKAKSQIWNEFSKSINSYTERTTLLKDLFIRLHNTIGDLSDIAEKLVLLNKKKDIDLSNLQKLREFNSLKETINYIKEQKENIRIKPHASCECSKDDFDKLLSLKNYLKSHEDINYKLVEHETVKIAAKSSVEYYTNLKTMFDVCPVCGNKINHV